MPAPTKIDGTSENGGIGRRKSDNLPEGVTISDLDLDHYTTAVELENLKDAVIDTESRVTALETGTDTAALTRTIGVDDFTDDASTAWQTTVANGGEVSQASNAALVGLPGAGALVLKASTAAGSISTALRWRTGLVRDTAQPIVLEARLTVINSGTLATSDDECQWAIGLASSADLTGDAVLLFAGLSPGRAFGVSIITAGVEAPTVVTMPALGAGESYRVRLTVLPGSVVLEAAIDLAEYATIATVTASVPAAVYHPFCQIERDAGAGNRMLLVDRIAWDGYRDVSTAAAGGDLVASGVLNFAGDIATVAADLASHAASANPHSGSVPTSRLITTTAPLTIGGGASADLSANRTLAVTAASTSATGVVELATTAETQTGTDTARAVTPAGLAATLQPQARSVSGSTDTISTADIGGVILMTRAGGCTHELPDLSGALSANRSIVITIQATDPAGVITVDPGSGVTIDGSASNHVAPTGRARVSLISLDGLAFYSGTP